MGRGRPTGCCFRLREYSTDIGDTDILTASTACRVRSCSSWSWQLVHDTEEDMPGVKPYENEDLLIKDLKKAVKEGAAKGGLLPRVLVIGALGRCGRGAVDLCTKVGLNDILVSSAPEHPNNTC